MIRRLIALALLAYGVAMVWTVYTIATHADPDPIPGASAIVVLSGPFADEPGEPDETLARVARGVALFEAGRAPLLVMSGGGSRALPGPGDAAFMAEAAIAAGVPADAIRTEANSHSTLQNAWMTARLDGIDPAAPVIIVTHRYHLSRAAASFRWAGFSDVTTVAADPEAQQQITPMLLLEGLKWPANILRAAGASAALAAGADEDDVVGWLR